MPEPRTDRRGGFEHSNGRELSPRRHLASLELLAGVALVISTAVAATVISIGIARADTPAADAAGFASSADPSFAVAVLFGFVLAAWAWLTVMMSRDIQHRD
jgi:hypothetical protein